MSPGGALRRTSEGQDLKKLDLLSILASLADPLRSLLHPKVTWTGTFEPACE